MKTFEGFVHVGLAKSKATYTVDIQLLEGSLPGVSQQGKLSGQVSCSDPAFAGLVCSSTPLWFALKGDNKRYEIRIFEDTSCEISWKWES
jgi:hypothetical protein